MVEKAYYSSCDSLRRTSVYTVLAIQGISDIGFPIRHLLY